MWDLFPLLLAAGLIVLWSLVLFALQRRGLLEPRGLSVSPPPAGPLLMSKTVRGRRLIARPFAVLFSSVMMASVTPVHDGVGIVGFTEGGSPAQSANIEAYTVITEVNNTPVHSYADFRNAMLLVVPGQNVSVVTFNPSNSTYVAYVVTLAAEPGTGRPL